MKMPVLLCFLECHITLKHNNNLNQEARIK